MKLDRVASSKLTMGKMVANTLISSESGVAWCFQSISMDALPINKARLSIA